MGTFRQVEGARLSIADQRRTEQTYVTILYERLDELRKRAADRLSAVMRQIGGTPAARTEREGLTMMYRQQLAQLAAAENGLCFGRLEFTDGARTYIGRVGMHAENDDYDQDGAAGRLLDPHDGNVTLTTLQRAAELLGRTVRLELE